METILILAWHLFVLGLGIVIGITIECNMEEDMRELIALRAKIDLLIDDIKTYRSTTEYNKGKIAALEWVDTMIDSMVGKQLEEMYAEHIQEENKADKH